jgi:type IV pilus assembly protein PilW
MRNHLREKGFTLLELMIAIFLGMLVLSAGYTVFQSSNRATQEQNAGNRMYDNARVAMDVVVRNFRRAGLLVNFTSYPIGQLVDGMASKVTPSNSAAAPDMVTITGGTLSTVGTLQRSADRGANTLFLTDVTGITAGSVIGVGLTYSGVVNAINVAAKSVTLNTTVPTGALNMYYPGWKLQDGATDSDQTPAPVRLLTSTRYWIDSVTNAAHPVLNQMTQGTTEPIAEDIEDLQIAYGVDSNNNRIIENNEWVNNPTNNQIDLIRLVRITIVARTAQPDPTLRNVAQTVPAIEDRPARANLTDGYRRFILTRIVKTRNIDAVNTL